MRKNFRITVLGNFSGRNAGDNAILGNLLRDISTVYPDVEFKVPTLNKKYVSEAFAEFNIEPFGLMPWNGSLKILGIPIFRAMLATDLVLVTDNILFDRSFFNPLFNYLATISIIAPFCRRRGIPIVLYNASLGPINSLRGAQAVRRVLSAGPVAVVRDDRSAQLIRELDPSFPRVVMGADCALNTPLPTSERIDEILAELGLNRSGQKIVGVNVNSYFDSWQSGSTKMNKGLFLETVASVVNQLIESQNVQIVFFVTQVMDAGISEELRKRIRGGDSIPVMANPRYNYSELAGVLSRLELLVAMRTHAQILSVSVGTPIVNINAYPKSVAFLETIDMHNWSVDVADLSEQRLADVVDAAWGQKNETRLKLKSEVGRERQKALSAVGIVGEVINAKS